MVVSSVLSTFLVCYGLPVVESRRWSMKLERALKDFLEFHEIDNQSQYTVRNYRRYVGPFVEWLSIEHGVVDTSGLQVTHLRGWMSHLQKTPNKRGKIYK